MKITCFLFEGLITKLNDLGFTHYNGFISDERNFKNGKGFIIDLDNKTYSYALVYDDTIKNKDEVINILDNYLITN